MLPDVSEKISYDCIFPRSTRRTENVGVLSWVRDGDADVVEASQV